MADELTVDEARPRDDDPALRCTWCNTPTAALAELRELRADVAHLRAENAELTDAATRYLPSKEYEAWIATNNADAKAAAPIHEAKP